MAFADSSAAALARVQSLELEVAKTGCPPLYVGQESHHEIASYLQANGFEAERWRWHGHLKCEGTGFFRRSKTRDS